MFGIIEKCCYDYSILLRGTTRETISEELIGIRRRDEREQSCVAFSIDEQQQRPFIRNWVSIPARYPANRIYQ